jgi:hypothetical protein
MAGFAVGSVGPVGSATIMPVAVWLSCNDLLEDYSMGKSPLSSAHSCAEDDAADGNSRF